MFPGITGAKGAENAVGGSGRKVTAWGSNGETVCFPVITQNQVHFEGKAVGINCCWRTAGSNSRQVGVGVFSCPQWLKKKGSTS